MPSSFSLNDTRRPIGFFVSCSKSNLGLGLSGISIEPFSNITLPALVYPTSFSNGTISGAANALRTTLGGSATTPGGTLAVLQLDTDYSVNVTLGATSAFIRVTDTFGLKWNELPATQIWTDYTTETWSSLLGVDVSAIDTPGTYDLFSSVAAPEPLNALNYVQIVADSGSGFIYETTSGGIGYQDQDARADYVSANGFVNISKNFILISSGSLEAG